jgi:hypothetical protein
MPNDGLNFHAKRRRLLASLGLATVILLLEVATARIFVHFARPNLNPGPLWLPFAVRIPLFLIMWWGTYRLLTIQVESYWHQMTTQDAVRNACQMLLNAAQVHESPQARMQIEAAVSRIQVVLSADPMSKRVNGRRGNQRAAKAS